MRKGWNAGRGRETTDRTRKGEEGGCGVKTHTHFFKNFENFAARGHIAGIQQTSHNNL